VSGLAQSVADGAVALAQPRRTAGGGAVLAATSVGSSLVFASGALLPVALAAVGRDLALAPSQLQWLVNAELLPLAALTLVAGAVGDHLGRRWVFGLGIFMVALGAIASALSPTWTVLFIARLTCGVGEALILPNSLAMLGQAFPGERKAYAVGVWSAVAAVASAAAPALAGAILDRGGWRAALALPVPLAAVALILALGWAPRGGSRSRAPIDGLGAGLSSLGLAALGWGLTRLTNQASLSGLPFAALAVAGLAFLALANVERRRGERAMLPPALMASRAVIGANLFTVLLYGPFTAMLTLLPFVMIQGLRLSPLLAGAAFIPLQLLIALVSPLAGRLCRRVGRRPPLILGALSVAVSGLAALRIGPQAGYATEILPAVLALAIGMSLAIAPLSTLVLTSVDPERAGIAAGVNSAVSRVGSLVAIALLGSALQAGPQLFAAFHAAMLAAAVSCGLAALAALIVPAGPHVDWIPAD
jgi:MFS family permease